MTTTTATALTTITARRRTPKLRLEYWEQAASKLAFAPRGELSVAQMVKRDLPEIGMKKAAPPPPPAAAPPPTPPCGFVKLPARPRGS